MEETNRKEIRGRRYKDVSVSRKSPRSQPSGRDTFQHAHRLRATKRMARQAHTRCRCERHSRRWSERPSDERRDDGRARHQVRVQSHEHSNLWSRPASCAANGGAMSNPLELSTVAAEAKPKRKYRTRNRMSNSQKLIRDLEAGYKANRKLLEKSLAACSIGTNSYLAHLKAMDDQFLKYADFRREIGVLPKNVGSTTEREFIFKAHAAKAEPSIRRVSLRPRRCKRLSARRPRKSEGQCLSAEDEAIRAGFDQGNSRRRCGTVRRRITRCQPDFRRFRRDSIRMSTILISAP